MVRLTRQRELGKTGVRVPLVGYGTAPLGKSGVARKEAAERYIRQSTLAIGEVAYLVGYSEPAAFHRAFKRWFGTTPEGFRQKQRHG